MEYLLGIDVGSSSVKAAILDANSGTCAGSAFYPKKEQIILAQRQALQNKILMRGMMQHVTR